MSSYVDIALFNTVFITLFVIMDPPGTVPVFLALTSAMGAKQRAHAALQAILVAFGVIVVFAIVGNQLFNYMGISSEALKASGGLLLLFVALELLTGKAEEPAPSANGGVNVALVPLGTPLLAGPGAIVATMGYVQEAQAGHADVTAYVAIAAAIVAVHLCLYLSMRFANVVHRVLKDSGTVLVSRIAGLLLAAIAVQMVADAVIGFVQTA